MPRKKRNPHNLFCFFEGEDAKYYCPRIEEYTNYTYDCITVYNCGGKKEVLLAYDLIVKKDDDNIAKAFFIDSDYDSYRCTHKLLYQTPCYSIENLYTSVSAFQKLINREFGINTSENDYKICCKDYIERKREFYDATMFFNTWLSCQRLQEIQNGEKKVKLSKFKISKLFSEISIQKIELKEPIDIYKLNELFPESKTIAMDEINKEITYFNERDVDLLFRGKFEMDFFKKIIDSLILLNKTGEYFSYKYTSVSVNPNINPLSSLSQYVDTPQCLIDFLRQYSS